MQTDIPLKSIAHYCPEDIAVLVGARPDAVVSAAPLELPSTATRLDTLLRLRHPDGTDSLHIIEWQGYRDEYLLWRVMGYLSWVGQHVTERPILVTIVYLHPDADVGDTLSTALPGLPGAWGCQFACLRLWQFDAAQALALRLPGLVALTPLLRGATAATVEEAARVLLERTTGTKQTELLAALRIMAEEIMPPDRLDRLITKEQLMGSSTIQELVQDLVHERVEARAQELVGARVEELVRERVEERIALLQRQIEQANKRAETAEQELSALMQATRRAETAEREIADLVLGATVSRFPDIPGRLLYKIRQISDIATLRQVLIAISAAPDQAAAQAILEAVER